MDAIRRSLAGSVIVSGDGPSPVGSGVASTGTACTGGAWGSLTAPT